MKRYIKIDFNSARLVVAFNRPKSKKPMLTEIGKNICNNKDFSPIQLPQVSNMLHVMLGERPVPTMRNIYVVNNEKVNNGDDFPYTTLKRDEVIDNIVRNGFYKVTNQYVCNDKEGNTYMINDLMKGKKEAPSNSQRLPIIYFDELYQFLVELYKNNNIDTNKVDNGYKALLDIISKYTNKPCSPENYNTLTEAFEDLYDHNKYENFIKAYNDLKKSPNKQQYKIIQLAHDLSHVNITDNFTKSFTNLLYGNITYPFRSNYNLAKGNRTQIVYTITLCGSFIFQVDDDIYEKLMNGNRAATFLDGGLATISTFSEFGYDDNLYLGRLNEYDIKNKNYQRIA